MADTLLVTSGRFGRDAGAVMRDMLAPGRHTMRTYHVRRGQQAASALTGKRARPATLAVLLSWRESAAEANAFERAAFRLGLPWLGVLHHHPVIRVGPVMRPDGGPCYLCYSTRLAQHDPENWADALLDQERTVSDGFGVSSMAPHLTAAAAGLAAMHIDGAIPPDRGVSLNLITERVASLDVIPVDGCRRCGDDVARAARGRRRTSEMVQLVSSLDGGTHAG